MNKRPNIIFIQNDHQAFYQWQEWKETVKRPNFERLAAEGAEFTSAYCTTPLCGPTRRSLLTGQYPHAHKQYFNYSDPPFEQEVYLDTLAEAGYENYYYGKWHAGPGNALDHHCEGFCHTSYGNPYVRPEYQEYLKRKGLPPAEFEVRHCFHVREFGYGDPDSKYYYDLKAGNHHYRSKDPDYCGEHAAGITVTPKETTESFFPTRRSSDLRLEQLAAREDKSRPFALRVDFWGPHQPYFPTQEYLDMYKDMKLSEYPSWNSGLEGKPAAYFRERNPPMGTDDYHIIIPNPMPWSYYNELLQYCAAQITMLDEAAGLILDKVRELGLDENTLIIYTTDHGDGLACQGGHFDKGSYMAQEVLRIPMAASWKGHIAPGQKREELVSSLSIPVTILDAAGLTFTKNKVHARSLLPLVTGNAGEPVDWPDTVVAETYGHGYGEEITSRVIVWKQYKYVASVGENNRDELYNLEQDKYELVNHIDDSEYADILAEMRRRLREWQVETDDPVGFEWAE